MTNLEWLIKEKPELAITCLSEVDAAVSVNKNTGAIETCDEECHNCLFSDKYGDNQGCVCRIAEWLKAEHKDKKQIKDLTYEEVKEICHNRSTCGVCELRLSNGFCYHNIIRNLKDDYSTTAEEIAEFGKKIVEV